MKMTNEAEFVRVVGGRFERRGMPYAFLGANMWYGMSLGAEGPVGDRPRLLRELDRLKALDVTNLRILAANEGPESEPYRIVPVLQPSPGVFREEMLLGLDFLLQEMARRDMVAVLYLNNFWSWSGGMAQYLSWSGAGPIPYPPPNPGGSWDAYQKFAQTFYSNSAAIEASHVLIRTLLQRKNRYTGTRYVDDPTIMAWQLANEPRGGADVKAFQAWIDGTSALIKSLDPAHLVTTGTEGDTPWPDHTGLDFVANHLPATIDYATVHLWVENWGFYDPRRPEETFDSAMAIAKSYLERHIEKARVLGKPMVLEEFGLARDAGSPDPGATTTRRDRFYSAIFDRILQAVRAGEPAMGVNFWAWSGEGRPRAPGDLWKAGDPLTGDPPHESQGWYDVSDRDHATLGVIADYALKIQVAAGSRSAGAPVP